MRTALALCGWLIGLNIAPLALAQSDEEQAREQLQTLRGQIQEINRTLQRDRGRRDTLQSQLREAEKELGDIQRDIRGIQADIEAGQARIAELDQQGAALGKARDEQQARIAAEMRTAWQLGQQGHLKILLNQEDPQTVARTLTYYRYFFDARDELIGEYRQTLRELDEIQAGIAAENQALDQRQSAMEQRRTQLARASATREEAVAALNARISDQGTQLKTLEADRARLEELLQSIERAVSELEVPEDYKDFAAARGAMPWPLAGKRSNRFGRSRNAGKMRWQGVNIPAREGDTVSAIHHGRVVYADWFRGSGLLMIIDHGEGYMSLYAHNQSLLRDVGEWVTGGMPISTVGSSGGQQQAGLYFEIRKDGKPVDPARWCKG